MRNREIFYVPIYKNNSNEFLYLTDSKVYPNDTHKDVIRRYVLSVNFLEYKLRKLGNSLIRNEYKQFWSEEYPSSGYCYIVAEVIYHYVKGNYSVYKFYYDNDTKSHWYLKNNKNGGVIDPTFNQFKPLINEKGMFEHGPESETMFYEGEIQTKKGKISRRGYELAQYLGLV